MFMRLLKAFFLFVLPWLCFGCNGVETSNDLTIEYVDAKFSLSIEGKPMLVSEFVGQAVNENIIGVYAIQLYKKNSKGVLEAYAYGLFDDISLFSLKLETNNNYIMEISFVKDAKTVVSTSSNGSFKKPFNIYRKSDGTSVTNKMTLSNVNYFVGLSIGKTVLSDDFEYDIPTCDRYYGVSSVVECIDSDVHFTVNLKRVVFALNISAKNILSGVMKVRVDGSSLGSSSPDVMVRYGEEKEVVFTFEGKASPSLEAKWIEDDYQENIYINMWYDVDESNNFKDLGKQGVSVRRRTSYAVEMTQEIGFSNSHFSVKFESDELIDSGHKVEF